ncbi:xylulokinase [candidate division KSB3 bacterium]|uniref:Xylulose kinase n=1 Tax=candidate division KSB3 bacterium TaxID=2044937 RepID=A0A9D5Q494_9BACT|nr:xylulokinase [candidate division KSB3 bacterium]MBD3323008.1 xylulokinase [candidate division KSB3 bacterium]
MKRYLLAHDLGTSGNKATLFTVEGELVASTTYPYGTHFFHNNWAEQSPHDWWKAVCHSTQELVKDIDVSEIAVIGFSGQMMGCLCVDQAGTPLRDSIIYCDQRAVQETEELLQNINADEIYRISGHRPSASYSLEKLMWVKNHEPEIYKKTAKMLHAKDYMNFKLTGRMYTEYTDASGMNVFDLNTSTWSDKIIAASGIDGEKLPEAKESTFVIGELTKAAAEATGLQPGIPVVAGGGDGLCAAVGVGSVKPGVVYNYLGSSSWIALATEEPFYDDAMRTFVWAHAVPGYVQPCGTMQTAGSSYSWLKNELGKFETAEAEKQGLSPYELINQTIAQSPPGANGVIFLPYLLGERTPRWNPKARGAFIGLNLEHTRADVFRSVLEGVAFNLGIILDILRKDVPDISEITVIGGGAKGEVWRQILADIWNVTIRKPNYLEEATSMGAAIIGGVGAGIFENFDVIDRFIKIDSVQEPIPENVDKYQSLKPIFDKCYHSLVDVYDDMAQLSISL